MLLLLSNLVEKCRRVQGDRKNKIEKQCFDFLAVFQVCFGGCYLSWEKLDAKESIQ